MKAIALSCALLLAATIVFVRANEEDVDESDVHVLTADNFDDFVKGEDLAVVEFYAPWCGHCKHLKPEYAKAATDLKSVGVKLGKVDATVHNSLGSKYKVQGYPTLFLFRNGRDFEYKGPREHKGIVDYVKKQIGPAAKPLTNLEEFKDFVDVSEEDNDYVVVGFFDGANAKSQLHSSFLLSSAKLRDDFLFGIVTDPAVTKAAGIDVADTKEGTIVAFKAFDDKRTVYTGSTKTAAVQDWLVTNSLPLIGVFNKERAPRYQKRGLPIAKFFTKQLDRNGANAKHMVYFMNRLEPAAKDVIGKILVTLANATDPELAHAMEDYGWKGKENGLVIESANGKQKYRFEKALKAENVKKFFADFLSNKLEQWIKSEEPPVTNDGPVKIVTGKTFSQIVDNDKDVLIEFYAPWCGHCKSLAPKWDKLGKKFKGVDSVVIAKIDGTANDYPPEYSVSGFPTIYFRPAGKDSKPKPYEGDREVTDFVAYLKKNSKTKWSFKGKGRK